MAARLVLDKRERKLIQLFAKGSVEVRTLDVGDILCEYGDGSGWIAERKTTDDLAASLQDGRWDEQCDRLLKTGLSVVYIVEGDLKDARFSVASLWGAVIRAELMEGVYVFRTWCLAETKELLDHLVTKMVCQTRKPTQTLVTNKRRKFSDPSAIWIRQIACIPTFSEAIARAILQHFNGSMRELREALRTPHFPDVPISATARLGKARIAQLQVIFNPSE